LDKIPADFDYVYHLAAERDSAGDRRCYETNVTGTRNLLDAIAEKKIKIRKFVHVSSLGAAGFSRNGRPKKEGDPLEPVSFYGKTKLEAEREVAGCRSVFPYLILRPCKIYGPGDRRILLHFKFVKYGLVPDLGLRIRFMSLCYISDFVEAMILAAESSKKDEIYFVSDGHTYSWEEFYKTIARVLNRRMRSIFIPEAATILFTPWLKLLARLPQKFIPLEPTTLNEIKSKSWTCDPSKFFRDFNFKPSMDLERGMEHTAEWFKRNRLI
jgi:nucleoside-diphosphate-sugar epimerase